MTSEKDVILNVSIPFCINTPKYTHGHFLKGDGGVKREYMLALGQELESKAEECRGRSVVALRLGGGGPSVMSPDLLGSFMRQARRLFTFRPHAEVSVEAIPHTVGVPSLTGWGQGGLNRVELNARAVNSRDLAELDAPYRVADVQNAILFLDKFGIHDVAIHLTYGIPNQTLASWTQTLRATLDFEPSEVVLQAITPLDGEGQPKSEQKKLYEEACMLLKGKDYFEYAVGRFSKEAGKSRFYQALYDGVEVIGVGLGAVSYVEGSMWRNSTDFSAYRLGDSSEGFPADEVFSLDSEAQGALYVRDALRRREGVSKQEYYDRFGCDFSPDMEKLLNEWLASDFVTCKDERIKLTPEGRFEWQWNKSSSI